MTLSEVQARTAEISARLRALSGGGVRYSATGALGTAATAPVQQSDFAGALRTAATAAPTAPTATAPASATARTAVAPLPGAAPAAAGPSAGDLGSRAVEVAQRALGTPYRWGGEAPGGFDCSGLMHWAYGQLGVDLPRVSGDQAKAGREVTAAQARPGDLVFFDRPGVDHIGMYAGNGRWVVAPKTGDVVKMQDVDLGKASTIRRIEAPALSVKTAGLDALPPAGRRYAAQITEAARGAGIEPALLAAVAWTESGFDPAARSPAGAQGLVQLMPRTARGLGVDDPTDPAQALAGGARYLKQQLDAFGRSDHALAAYNAGPTAVRKHGGIPPYEETQTYVTRVLDRVRTLGGTT